MFWFFFFGAKEDLNRNNDRCLRGVDSPIPEQQLHTPGIHVKLAGSFMVLHNHALQILLSAYGL